MANMEKVKEILRPHRTIPHTPWSAKNRWDINFVRVIILVCSLIPFGFGEALLIQSHTGNSPWSVFAQGLSRHIGLDLGISTFIISGCVLLLWWPLGERPGFGTIANMCLIALGLQIGSEIFPIAHNFGVGLIYDFLGIALIGIGSAFYITCGLGPGPRDGLMTSLHKKTGVRVSRIRLGIEATALMCGWLLGGRVGVGTALFALLIGQSVAISLGTVSRITQKLT